MSDARPADDELPVLPTVVCPYCSNVVPRARFCGACGADLVLGGPSGARRLHAYAAFPDEPVLRLSIVTSLFPHLPHRAKIPFRAALALILVLLVAFSAADAAAPLMALCSLGVPLLFLLYVLEVDPYEDTFLPATVAAFVMGAGLGTGWALIGGPYADRALLPSPTASLTSAHSVISATVVPIVGQLLVCVPILVVRWMQRGGFESLDGFAVGSTGALGFTLASTIVLLSPWLSYGPMISQSFLSNVATAVVRGMTFPLVSAMVTGFIGATVWQRAGGRSAAPGRWLTSPLVALLAAMAIQIGSAFANLAALPDPALVVVQLGTVVVGVVVMRIGLHHVLVHEAAHETIGPPRVCPQCAHLVPAMAFCPQCGVAERAIPRWRRLPWSHGGGVPRAETAGGSAGAVASP